MFVYAMRGGGYAKIGVSDNIERRLATFNSGALPFEMTIVCLAETDTVTALEREVLILASLPGRLRGEWIDGAVSDKEIASAFATWTWSGGVLVSPTEEQVTAVNRSSALQRQLEASREVAKVLENATPANVDWHRIATELTARGDVGALRKVKKAFKANRLRAQRRAGNRL